MQNSL